MKDNMLGNYLALYKQGRIELRDAESHAEVKSIPVGARGTVFSVSFGCHGTLLAVSTTFNKVLVFDVDTSTKICELESHEDTRMRTVVFNSAGTRLLTRSYEGRVDALDFTSQARIWTVVLNTYLSYPLVCFTIDDQRVVASLDGDDASHVVILDSMNGQRLMTLEGHKSLIRSVTVSPAGDCIASSADDNAVMIWDQSTGSCVRAFTGLAYAADNVAYCPDGCTLVIAMEGSMTLYCVDTWNVVRTISMSRTNGRSFCLSVNFIGSRIACTYWNRKIIAVCDIEQQSEIFDLRIEKSCSACCYSSGGVVLM
jgi:WD40 repeat protein